MKKLTTAFVLSLMTLSSAQAESWLPVTCEFYSGHINVTYRFDLDFEGDGAFRATANPSDPESKSIQYELDELTVRMTPESRSMTFKASGYNDSDDYLQFEVNLTQDAPVANSQPQPRASARIVDSEADGSFVYGSAISTTCTIGAPGQD